MCLATTQLHLCLVPGPVITAGKGRSTGNTTSVMSGDTYGKKAALRQAKDEASNRQRLSLQHLAPEETFEDGVANMTQLKQPRSHQHEDPRAIVTGPR